MAISQLANVRLVYTYRIVDICTGGAVGPIIPVIINGVECAGLGEGLWIKTRLFHSDTCTFDAPIWTKAGSCPLVDCP